MSGPFGSSQWMYASGGFYGFPIEQSLRFNDDDSARLTLTPASAGSRTTWTFSAWVKRGNLGTSQNILREDTGDNLIRFETSNSFRFFTKPADSGCDLITNAVFRDASAWYHVVCVYDTTQATSSERAKVYINGNRVTQFSTETYPAQNHNSYINNNVIHGLGGRPTGGEYFDGYLAEVNFIDGQALDASSFGEFKSGVWTPKRYGGTYGTNGFRLSFADSSNIGDDTSGNTNDWTANSLVATDVLLDSPTNNFATLNPLKSDGATLSEGNAKVVVGTSGGRNSTSTFAVSSGKWYAESVCTANTINSNGFGVTNVNRPNSTLPYIYSDGVIYEASTGQKHIDGTNTSYGATFTTGDVIGIALDLDNDEITFYKNGSSQGTITTKTFNGTYEFVLPNFTGSYTVTYVANFGQDSSFAGNKTAQGNTDDNGIGDFYEAPPSGYLALCTANLPDPVIDPAQDDVPSDYFNTVLYTGTGAAQSITGVGFQPDVVWMKRRDAANSHDLIDAVRGDTNRLFPDLADGDFSVTFSFNADGFSPDPTKANENASGGSYVAWNWKANGAGVANTDGTISSTVSANQKAGFSIVSYTGTGANATVGHGLGAVPAMIIVKNRDQADAWQVYHGANTAAPETDYLVLNTTAATADAADRWNDTTPTSSVFSIGTGAEVNTSSEDYIAYCFAEVEGYSKFGSYTGNGSADGPFVYTGFRPAWVMIKSSSNASTPWQIFDATRETFNTVEQSLVANGSNAEPYDTASPVDFLSNGFKLRGGGSSWNNYNTGTWIYACFSEQPFKYANAR